MVTTLMQTEGGNTARKAIKQSGAVETVVNM
jgi:hypothetical protein